MNPLSVQRCRRHHHHYHVRDIVVVDGARDEIEAIRLGVMCCLKHRTRLQYRAWKGQKLERTHCTQGGGKGNVVMNYLCLAYLLSISCRKDWLGNQTFHSSYNMTQTLSFRHSVKNPKIYNNMMTRTRRTATIIICYYNIFRFCGTFVGDTANTIDCVPTTWSENKVILIWILSRPIRFLTFKIQINNLKSFTVVTSIEL